MPLAFKDRVALHYMLATAALVVAVYLVYLAWCATGCTRTWKPTYAMRLPGT